MDLPAFIREEGEAESAKLLGVSLRTIKSWKYGERVPRPNKAVEIERVTKGRVPFSHIYAIPPRR